MMGKVYTMNKLFKKRQESHKDVDSKEAVVRQGVTLEAFCIFNSLPLEFGALHYSYAFVLSGRRPGTEPVRVKLRISAQRYSTGFTRVITLGYI